MPMYDALSSSRQSPDELPSRFQRPANSGAIQVPDLNCPRVQVRQGFPPLRTSGGIKRYTATLREKERFLFAPGPGAAAGGHQGPAPPPPPVVDQCWCRVGPLEAAPAVVHTGLAAPGKPALVPQSLLAPLLHLADDVLAASPAAVAAAAGPLSQATEPFPDPYLPQRRPCCLSDLASETASPPVSSARTRSVRCRTAPKTNQGCTQVSLDRRRMDTSATGGSMCARGRPTGREKQEKNPG
ncbi:uncharacterized protein LOC110153885 [Boleophthalmus pectinirostris]|uniref:uncharacterized protein LOC110153885 n=1 Tax=Boleophthalmus pectinirostris TaxID=150288 RepID=UPI0024305BA7|nr:uncharacterized protein LOC110153885 [Boleophthalmus pectinirostris]